MRGEPRGPEGSSGGANARKIEVLNGSPYTLREVSVIPARTAGESPAQRGGPTSVAAFRSQGAIGPGERALCDQAATIEVGALSAPLWNSAPMMIAGIDDAPLGPQLGTIIHSRTWTQLVVSGEVR